MRWIESTNYVMRSWQTAIECCGSSARCNVA
jgi:hypothetical protein